VSCITTKASFIKLHYNTMSVPRRVLQSQGRIDGLSRKFKRGSAITDMGSLNERTLAIDLTGLGVMKNSEDETFNENDN
jgi:hypothetical protein